MFNIIRASRSNIRNVCKFSTSVTLNKDADDGDEDRKINAKKRLQSLLAEMASVKQEETPKIRTTVPVKRVVEKRPIYKIDLKKVKDKHTAQLVRAVKDVADEVGGSDVKTTEAELLHVLLNNKRPGITLEGDTKSLDSVISGMQVEREDTRAAQVRRQLPPHGQPKGPRLRDTTPETPINLFGHAPLNIFPVDFTPSTSGFELPIWSKLSEKELKLLVTHPPTNIFEEMILWTERGKLWKFPIDNEQGMDLEKSTDFTEHVFLDEHLEGWCPAKGPIRHFMELVLVGLSKNPYITVQAKIDHIIWFRDYFESKKKLLFSTGAIPTNVEEKTAVT